MVALKSKEMIRRGNLLICVYNCLYDLTGVENRTKNNALVKVLDAHPKEWPHITEGVFSAHRVS